METETNELIQELADWMVTCAAEGTKNGSWTIYADDIVEEFTSITEEWLEENQEEICNSPRILGPGNLGIGSMIMTLPLGKLFTIRMMNLFPWIWHLITVRTMTVLQTGDANSTFSF